MWYEQVKRFPSEDWGEQWEAMWAKWWRRRCESSNKENREWRFESKIRFEKESKCNLFKVNDVLNINKIVGGLDWGFSPQIIAIIMLRVEIAKNDFDIDMIDHGNWTLICNIRGRRSYLTVLKAFIHNKWSASCWVTLIPNTFFSI